MMVIPAFTLIRFFSMGLVALLYVVSPADVYKMLLISILFGHYALSVFYAKNQVGHLVRDRRTWPPLAVLFALSFVYIFSGAYIGYLAAFIGLHIALSDTYMGNQIPALGLGPAQYRYLNLARFIFNICLYLLVLHRLPLFAAIPLGTLHVVIALSLGYMLARLARVTGVEDSAARRDFICFEGVALVAAYGIYFLGVILSPQAFVFYHVVSWLLFPSWTFYRRSEQWLLRVFLGWAFFSALFFAGLFLLLRLRDDQFDAFAYIPFWASLHFLSSFALSQWNPVWIRTFFYPASPSK